MAEQLALVPAEPKLTDRQQFALDQLEQTGGLTAEALGARMHDRRDKHPAGITCRFCFDEGKAVANELRRKGLAVRRRTGVWQSLRADPKPASTAQTDEIPF